MVDITHKSNSLRIAIAEAFVKVSSPETIKRIEENSVPKGNIFEMSKAAGLFGVKKTAEMIPDCHPLPIEYTDIQFEIQELRIRISIEVKTIYKTGVEVEAMHGASVVALTIYDMLKPIDKGVEIENIRLVSKKGGKTDFNKKSRQEFKASVVVCSDTISAGVKEDKAGKAIIEKLELHGVETINYSIIPDEVDQIQSKVKNEITSGIHLLIFTGGTGLSSRDVSPEAIRPLLDREIPGIAEAIRSYGQDRTPYSMLSRSVVGEKNGVLVMALPGSTKGASESMDAVFPAILHVFGIMKGAKH